jgi:photosystem II stability/assembly factor-like uncharacterized protein
LTTDSLLIVSQTILTMKIYNLAFLLLFQYPFTSPVTDSQQKLNRNKSGGANIVFKSTDGGQTWQDISEGLPESLRADSLWRDDFFADDNGLYLGTGKDGIYHSKPNSTASFWEKENFPYEQGRIAPGKNRMFAYNNNGQFLQKINGTNVWSPMNNFRKKEANTVFETVRGTVFIASNQGLLKSTNSGKTWKEVLTGGSVMKLVESNDVLLATCQWGVLRSTDDGENWDWVINEGGIGIAVERIDGGFAAINADRESKTSRVRTSYDGGKTWQAIDAGLPATLGIASIIEVDEYLFCGHSTGIFRSSDKGKTWKLLLPSIENKVFNLFVSGKVIYAVPLSAGC